MFCDPNDIGDKFPSLSISLKLSFASCSKTEPTLAVGTSISLPSKLIIQSLPSVLYAIKTPNPGPITAPYTSAICTKLPARNSGLSFIVPTVSGCSLLWNQSLPVFAPRTNSEKSVSANSLSTPLISTTAPLPVYFTNLPTPPPTLGFTVTVSFAEKRLLLGV